MSSFYVFSPEESEVDESEQIRVPSPTSEVYAIPQQPIEVKQTKPALATRKRSSRKSHPTYAVMVDEAVFNRSAIRKGLSLAAVKKYLLEKYELNIRYAARNINLVVRDALEKGRYIKTSGRGLSGRFRLSKSARHALSIRYANPASKVLKINIRAGKRKAMINNKIKNSNRKKGEVTGNNRKRRANPTEATNGEEIKRPRREGHSRMKS